MSKLEQMDKNPLGLSMNQLPLKTVDGEKYPAPGNDVLSGQGQMKYPWETPAALKVGMRPVRKRSVPPAAVPLR